MASKLLKIAFGVAAIISAGAGTSAIAANEACPYDLRGSGLTAAEIQAICDEWARSIPGNGISNGDGSQWSPGQNCWGVCSGQVK